MNKDEQGWWNSIAFNLYLRRVKDTDQPDKNKEIASTCFRDADTYINQMQSHQQRHELEQHLKSSEYRHISVNDKSMTQRTRQVEQRDE